MAGGWSTVRLVEGVQLSDNNNLDVLAPTATNETDIAGGPSDLWGLTLDEAKVEGSLFGVDLSLAGALSGEDVSFSIDAVRMKVYYTQTDSISLNGSSTMIGATESQIAAGGRTIILDLNNVTWLTAGSSFDATRQTIINIVDSQQAETLGWDNEIKAKIGVGQVVRTSDTRVTITLLAAETGDYKIVVDEVIDLLSLAASAHSGSTALSAVTAVATITAECDQTLAPDSIATQTNLSGAVTDIDESVDSPDANWLLVA